jgi:hypothetical protein
VKVPGRNSEFRNREQQQTQVFFKGESMGFFDKLLGESEQRKNIRIKLQWVDFRDAFDNFNLLLKTMKEEGEKKGEQSAMKTEVVQALDVFMKNPCLNTAIPLVEAYPPFIDIFELTKSPIAKLVRERKLYE